MKLTIKTLLIILLVFALLAAAAWFFLVYRTDLTTSVMTYWGAHFYDAARYNRAVSFYGLAWKLSPDDAGIPIRLAEAYVQEGNYTKAEYTLVSAITRSASAKELYIALSGVYVAQDKLLDAEDMLSRITNDAVRAEIEALRPEKPVIEPESGYYTDYIDVTVTGSGDKIYAVLNEDFPSGEADVYTEPFTLSGGESKIVALCVGENGLVSEAAYAGYTVGSVVEPVSISDPALNAYVYELLGKPAGQTLMSDELWAVEALELPEGMASYADLPLFAGLKSLSLHTTSADADLTVLGTLTTLQSLDLSGCTVSSATLEAISALPDLRELNLSECSLAAVNSLVGLSSIQVLNLAGNTVSDITALSALTTLRELTLSNNPIGSVGTLKNCMALELLRVDGCKLTSLNGLQGHTALRELYASNNQIKDLSVLSGCSALTTLEIGDNEIEDVSVLTSFSALQVLIANNNQIKTLPALAADTPLWRCDLSYNEIEDISPLADVDTLNFLNLDYNKVSSLKCLENSRLLMKLEVWNNPVSAEEVKALQDIGVVVHYNSEYQPEDDA